VKAPKAFETHLLRAGVLDEQKLDRARGEAQKNGMDIVEVIPQLGYAKSEDVYQALADFCEMRFVRPSKLSIPPELIAKVSAKYVTHYRFVPIEERNGVMVIATADPLNASLLDDIRLMLKQRIEAVVATPEEIRRVTKEQYGVGADTMEKIVSSDEQDGVLNLQDSRASAELDDANIDASIIKFVNELLAEAIKSETTDIHIEPFESELRVRYRIDGILHQAPTPPSIRSYHAAIVSRVKIMANMNIAERRLPQDGKIRASVGDMQFDLRVSILPTPHGETVNIRVLNRSSMFLTLNELGFQDDELKIFNSFITKPYGIILVTGPTGSGKTTTLYAALGKLNNLDRKIITIEDPIEYQMEGISQMQVHPQIGFNFSMGLRSMLRHDPDIMLVGEIRDLETAEMAIRSSLTGHLVLSTLHTNDAAGAVTRLADMGVEPFLISSTMIASIAQRLLRRTCKECGAPYIPEAAVLREEFGVDAAQLQGARFVKGAGCDVCRHTGYRGRVAIYEILPFTPAIKEATVNHANSHQIKKIALSEGMRSLRQTGWRRVRDGETTLEEVMRVTADAEIMGESIESSNASIPV